MLITCSCPWFGRYYANALHCSLFLLLICPVFPAALGLKIEYLRREISINGLLIKAAGYIIYGLPPPHIGVFPDFRVFLHQFIEGGFAHSVDMGNILHTHTGSRQ